MTVQNVKVGRMMNLPVMKIERLKVMDMLTQRPSKTIRERNARNHITAKGALLVSADLKI